MFGLIPATIAAGPASSLPAMMMLSAPSLAHLSPLDIAVIAIYFAMVIWIGFYLKGQANTSEEFFMAGPRDDGVDRGLELCFAPTLARSN